MKYRVILLFCLTAGLSFCCLTFSGFQTTDTTSSFTPDTGVNGIQLLRWKTTVDHFGEDTSFVNARIRRHINYDFTYADFTNNDESQRLQLFVHLGYGLHELAIAEIRVKYAADFECRGCVKFPDDEYISSLGVKLGMSKEEVIQRVGKPSRLYFVKTIEVLEYRNSNINSSFLRRYNQPSYFAYYRFKEGLLNSYHIGFDTH